MSALHATIPEIVFGVALIKKAWKRSNNMSIPAKNTLQGRYRDVTTASGLSSKAITAVEVYQHGAVEVVEISFSGGSQFIKLKQGVVEVGGTAEWDSGVKV
jgi:hypothetical protein